ncbi:discoidin domain-containing protein, partial [Croceitalea vernalis]
NEFQQADNANDGVFNDINNINHTAVSDLSPWWEVDLETVSYVESVRIYNRADNQPQRFRDFYVLTSTVPISETEPVINLIKDSNINVTFFGGQIDDIQDIDIMDEARYVRIHFPENGSNRIMHGREFEVYGCEIVCANPVVFGNTGPFVKNTGIEQLTADIAGGTWSGDVDASGNFDTNVQAGTYSATYTVTDGDNCTQSASVDIVVASCATLTNVALNQFSEQSTPYLSGTPDLANDGNRTGENADFYDNGDPPDLQHTDPAEKNIDGTIPWWQVDLGAVADIDNIEVFNRTDVAEQSQAVLDRLANFYVFTSMTPFNKDDTLQDIIDDAADTANTTVTETFFSGAVDVSAVIAIAQQGRYVRIQLSIPDILHMAEVEVNGCAFTCTTDLVMQDYEFVQNTGIEQITPVSTPTGGAGVWYGDVNAAGEFDTNQATGTYSATYVYTDTDGCIQSESSTINLGLCIGVENLAFNKPAKQSSTQEQGAAYLAFDGILNGNRVDYLEQANVQHTVTDIDPDDGGIRDEDWLEVDLGSMATIQSFEVYNRADPDNRDFIYERLADFSIFVSRLPFDEDATHAELVTAANNGDFDHYQYAGNPGLFAEFDFTTAGRYVRLHLPPNGGNRTLHISELRVFGCANACQTATISGNNTYLETDADVTLTGDIGTNSSFGGDAATSGLFSPSTLGPGTYTVAYTYDDTDGCSQTVQKQIQVTTCNPTSTNLALNKTAEQSTTYNEGVAGLAVDGNLVGNDPFGVTADLQHTDTALNNEEQWWQVDLGALADIDDVVIHNRNGGTTTQENKDRLNFFYVFVSETPFVPGVILDDLINDNTIFQTKFYGAAGDVETIPIGAQGRYVRIQLDRGVVADQPARIIHMAEVQVFGCEVVCDPEAVLTSPALYLDTDGVQNLEATPAGGTWSGAAVINGNQIDPSALGLGTYTVTYTVTNAGCTQQKDFDIKVSKCSATQNLALVGTASQSSTFNNDEVTYAASFAIDGNTSQINGPIQHTGTGAGEQNQPWWQVDLGIVANLEELRIFNRDRPDLYTRLSNFYILTSSLPFPGGSTLNDLLIDPNVTSQFYNGGVGVDVTIPYIAEAQYVRIQLTNAANGVLHMSEVQVFGCELSNPCLGEPVTTLDPAGPFTTA